jgi:hypothetical protein
MSLASLATPISEFLEMFGMLQISGACSAERLTASEAIVSPNVSNVIAREYAARSRINLTLMLLAAGMFAYISELHEHGWPVLNHLMRVCSVMCIAAVGAEDVIRTIET